MTAPHPNFASQYGVPPQGYAFNNTNNDNSSSPDNQQQQYQMNGPPPSFFPAPPPAPPPDQIQYLQQTDTTAIPMGRVTVAADPNEFNNINNRQPFAHTNRNVARGAPDEILGLDISADRHTPDVFTFSNLRNCGISVVIALIAIAIYLFINRTDIEGGYFQAGSNIVLFVFAGIIITVSSYSARSLTIEFDKIQAIAKYSYYRFFFIPVDVVDIPFGEIHRIQSTDLGRCVMPYRCAPTIGLTFQTRRSNSYILMPVTFSPIDEEKENWRTYFEQNLGMIQIMT